MTDPKGWWKVSATGDNHTISMNVSDNQENVVWDGVDEIGPSEAKELPDGSINYSFVAWPGREEVKEYGSLSSAALPIELATIVGRAIIHSALMEQRLKALLKQLCEHNQTTLDWRLLSKFGQIVTRLQTEAALIRKQAPVGSKMLADAAEKTRKLHRSRGNLAHGEFTLGLGWGEFYLVAASKHGTEYFTEKSLLDLTLQMCRVSYELKAALDPADRDVQRASRETRFLQDLQANNPLPVPTPPKPPPRPRSSKP